MNNESITININRLREDLYDECMAAYFGGGIGTALFDAADVENASPDELVEIAKQMGFNLRKYRV